MIKTEYEDIAKSEVQRAISADEEALKRLSGNYIDNVNAYVRAAGRWVGPSRGSYDPTNPDYSRPSYTTVDASIGALWQAWDLSLYVKNLLNDQTILQRPLVQFLTEAYRQRPRTIGLLLTAKF